jgi:alanine dehydrogenase
LKNVHGWDRILGMKIKVFSKSDIKQAISMEQAIAVLRDAFIQLSAGKAVAPLRSAISIGKHSGLTLFMPAYLEESDALGAKIVSVFPDNKKNQLPSIHALVILIDARSGTPRAILDGTYLTALRTGAVSGLATELLARKNGRVVAIFGAGVQGRTQLEAVCSVRRIEKVWVYDLDHKASEGFVADMRSHGQPIPSQVLVAHTPAEAIREADIVCAATTSSKPVFSDVDVRIGTHINGVGSFTPEAQEIPPETVLRAKVVVDSREAALAEAGDLVIPLNKGKISPSHIYAEIGELAAGKLPGRESRQELTFFKSVGLAIQDVAVASFVLQNGEKLGLGKEFEL